MVLDIAYIKELDVVWVDATGEMTNEMGMEIFEGALKIAAENNCDKILFDCTKMKMSVSTVDIYQNPSYLEQKGFPRYFKLADVYFSDKEKHKFWETVARNNGFQARSFTDKDKALKWLNNT